jgi:hypothetical protein
MDLDLETFLTALYFIVDDFYQSRNYSAQKIVEIICFMV